VLDRAQFRSANQIGINKPALGRYLPCSGRMEK